MKKLIVLLLLVVVFVFAGCSEQSKVETPPWSDEQVKQMKNDEVESVPFAILRF